MLKFLLIIFLISYVVFRLGGFFFKILSLGTQRNSPEPKRPPGSNVEIDFVPRKDKNRKGFNGGEYVDYEEVN